VWLDSVVDWRPSMVRFVHTSVGAIRGLVGVVAVAPIVSNAYGASPRVVAVRWD